jgi:nucleoside phosphorylase
MKILIVDDSPEKARALERVASASLCATAHHIESAPDLVSAKRILRDKHIDIVLLDLLIPARYPTPPVSGGGAGLLELLSASGLLPVSFVIGVTEYGEEERALRQTDLDILWGVIKYDRASSAWEEQLQRKLRFAQRSLSETIATSLCEYPLGIVCALKDPELSALRRISEKWEQINSPEDGFSFFRGSFADQARHVDFVAASADTMGMAASCALACKMASVFRPQFLFAVGIMAGVRGEVNIGDVVIADPCWDYGSGKFRVADGEQIFDIDPQQERLEVDLRLSAERICSDHRALSDIKQDWPGARTDTEIRVHIGPVASGSAVVGSSDQLVSIRSQQRKLLGIEMEAYGILVGARRCFLPPPKTLICKGVCDYADEAKNDSHQPYAAFVSARVARLLAFECVSGEH